MKTLTPENLAGYLPYGLKVLSNSTIFEMDTYSNMRGSGIEKRDIHSVMSNNMVPFLRPLSDLTKPINDSCHLLELAKIAFPEYPVAKYVIEKRQAWFIIDIGDQPGFSLSFDGICFMKKFNGVNMQINQLALFRYLYKNHFDVDGLIGDGLALKIED